MISYLSGCIVRMLLKNEVIKTQRIEIYTYGFEIFISSCITFLIAILSGVIFDCVAAALVYFVIFAVLRQICGGYHARSYWSCNVLFTIATIFVLLFFKYISIVAFEIPHYISIALWVLCVFAYTPIENENKPMSKRQKFLLHKISRFLCVVLALISCLFYILQTPYAILLDVTLLVISLAILVVGAKGKRGESK